MGSAIDEISRDHLSPIYCAVMDVKYYVHKFKQLLVDHNTQGEVTAGSHVPRLFFFVFVFAYDWKL